MATDSKEFPTIEGGTPETMSATDKAEGMVLESHDEHEVFKKLEGAVDFRTVGWPMATIIFLKRMLHCPSCYARN